MTLIKYKTSWVKCFGFKLFGNHKLQKPISYHVCTVWGRIWSSLLFVNAVDYSTNKIRKD